MKGTRDEVAIAGGARMMWHGKSIRGTCSSVALGAGGHLPDLTCSKTVTGDSRGEKCSGGSEG